MTEAFSSIGVNPGKSRYRLSSPFRFRSDCFKCFQNTNVLEQESKSPQALEVLFSCTDAIISLLREAKEENNFLSRSNKGPHYYSASLGLGLASIVLALKETIPPHLKEFGQPFLMANETLKLNKEILSLPSPALACWPVWLVFRLFSRCQ